MPETTLKVIGVVEDQNYATRLEQDAKKREKGIYPRTIFIGVGGTGAKALLHLRRLVMERFGAVGALEGVAYLSIDTDVRSKEVDADEKRKNPLDEALGFEKDERVNVKIDFKNYVGRNIIHHPQIRDWWDDAALPSDDFNIEAGAGQIRPLSRLAFFTNKGTIQSALRRAYRKVSTNQIFGARVDMESPVRIVIVAGLAGGTGSGMILDLPALVYSELHHHENLKIESLLVLPATFSGVEQEENFPKLAANGFAALRELNHYLTHPFEVQWESTGEKVEVSGLFNRYVLFSGTNHQGEQLGDLSDCYRTIGEILFLDFGAGPMAGWIQGVRVNREQYLRSAVTYTYRLAQADGSVKETHTDRWPNQFSSIGFSKLVFPSWRLINKAKYELAAEMVGLLDPGRLGEMSDVITNYRTRFMFDCGFFQGERETDEGRRSHWQIRDHLARQTGAGQEISSVYDHIVKFQNEMVELAESMYTENNSSEECNATWKRISSLWGDPSSPGNEGDWPRQITENRYSLVKHVHARLPEVIESFRRKRAVGVSGVVALLRDILQTLDRPADQAHYGDWFRQQRQHLATQMQTNQALWTKRIKNADRAASGVGKSVDSHLKAVSMAGEALNEYWRAQANDFICQEGEKALEGIRKSLREHLSRVEHIAERMQKLESEYRRLADFYAVPQESHIIREIEVATEGDLLGPYLGRDEDDRKRKLERLLEKGLREMGLNTLEEIGDKLTGSYEKFRDNLSAQAFYALRGENGRTTAFSGSPDEAAEGFIERYSIFRVLKDNFGATQRREIFDQLFRKGVPWVRKNQADALVNIHQPHADAFIGYIAEGYEEIAREMVERLGKVSESFSPQPVRAYDPSEIIFYSELNAFPVYYPSEISSLKGHYETLADDRSTSTPLHLHQDYHKFQAIMPFNTGQVASFQAAWNLFLQAQMLGLVCSLRQRADDDTRIVYQWRRKIGPFEVQWTDLGAEGRAIRRLMTDNVLVRQLRSDIETAQERLLKSTAGRWGHLVALADYYYHCIFPVIGEGGALGAGPQGSMENLVASTLRQEWRGKAGSSSQIEYEVEGLLDDLAEWTRPVYREQGQLVPRTPAVPAGQRVEEWKLLEKVDRAVRSFVSQGLLSESRDIQGNQQLTYPRLAIHWDLFDKEQRDARSPERATAPGAKVPADEPPALEPSVGEPPPLETSTAVSVEAEEALFHYARDKERQGRYPASKIASLVTEAPESDHRVWTNSFGREWRRAAEVPEIAAFLPAKRQPKD